ncbi:MAG: hypothetical protein ABR500_05385 [Dermatophilaceae bacterium]|nr:hypothetical protein [Intrasporangiaceae bacterium]
MPWAPGDDADSETRNARLDPFRERAGVLLGGGEDSGADVFLRAETHWSRVSGHLWWSRWSGPHEAVHGYVRDVDGRFTDWLSSGGELEIDLDYWLSGSFRYAGRTYRVQWQDDAESFRVRDEVFGRVLSVP